MTNGEIVTKWVLDTVQEQYAEDIALVVSHTTLRIDPEQKTISYFVPVTKRGEGFARTFLLGGEGFDIWAVPWERLEKFAALEEYNITCLADGEILYARNEADAERFESLKKEQAQNLADPQKMRAHALQAYAEAKSIYQEMLFAKGSDVKLGAGYVLDYLARAIAFSNRRYFQKSQTDQIAELHTMECVPEAFLRQYPEVIAKKDEAEQKRLCYELICTVRDFLTEQKPDSAEDCREHNFQDLADWYGELSYTWLRIRHYGEAGDLVKAYMWGILLQNELNQVCEDFGLEKMELMSFYDVEALEGFAERANELEKKMRSIITAGGGVIHEYETKEALLHSARQE